MDIQPNGASGSICDFAPVRKSDVKSRVEDKNEHAQAAQAPEHPLGIEGRDDGLENFLSFPFFWIVQMDAIPGTRHMPDPFFLEGLPVVRDFPHQAGKLSPEICEKKDIFFQCRKYRSLVENTAETTIDLSCIRSDHIICNRSDQSDFIRRAHCFFITAGKVFCKFLFYYNSLS